MQSRHDTFNGTLHLPIEKNNKINHYVESWHILILITANVKHGGRHKGM